MSKCHIIASPLVVRFPFFGLYYLLGYVVFAGIETKGIEKELKNASEIFF